MPRPELIPSRGAVAEPLTLEVTRELTASDLLRLSEAPKVGVPLLQKLRATHHRMAQLQASGKTMGQIAAIVGCTTARLTQLQGDPTYTELVAYYNDQIMTAMIEDSARLRDKIVDAGEMAVDELRDRLEDDAKRTRMSTSDVRQIAEFAMDRTVAPPKAAPMQSVVPGNITINFGTPIKQPPTLDGTLSASNGVDLLGEESEE
jgi:hypothetical protein